ncbi:IS982 family transposase [Zunongwangia sp. SCSIO 43204]|uniref:IS982 family transposase n=1 Tax=Zunongwangia sp. SCSIO 43204 TaxID=2779359 RepID=UPI001CA8DDFC|nr:IS982 family transposase [Zunongwangia sp. SCSIO 43204]UAB86205.1 IS982 family transposase [Zunongwangia sp. SCSIO 43204]
MLQDKVIAIYCLTDDLLKEMNHKEHKNRLFTDGQVITTALVSALYFRGNQSLTLDYMHSHIFDQVIKKSGFTKRLHKLKETLMFILLRIGRVFKYLCCEMEYIIDSFPVKACHNIRINRCKLFRDEKYRGYNASKREHFYGVKIQLVTTADGIPVEMYLVEGAEHDSQILGRMYHDLPPESSLFGDSGYTNYEIEDMFREVEQVDLQISRKSNSKRKDIPAVAFIKEHMRKRIETTISQISALMPRHINAVTANGFLLKLILFVMAFQVDKCILE